MPFSEQLIKLEYLSKHAAAEWSLGWTAMSLMARTGKRKNAGRPAIGKDRTYSFRLPAAFVADLDAWAKAHDVSRAEAMRRLVEIGLTTSHLWGLKTSRPRFPTGGCFVGWPTLCTDRSPGQLRRHSPFNHITSRQSATLAFKDVPFLVPVFRVGFDQLDSR